MASEKAKGTRKATKKIYDALLILGDSGLTESEVREVVDGIVENWANTLGPNALTLFKGALLPQK